jgi:tellurite resistance protein TehA-like permease
MAARVPTARRGHGGLDGCRGRGAPPNDRGIAATAFPVDHAAPSFSRPAMTLFSRILYTAIAGALLAASVLLIGVAIWRTTTGFWTGDAALETMLDGIGLIIIAVAVADVGKFLFEEEVVSDRELRRPAEARGSLTKFMTIIIIALSLESLVLITKASRTNMSDIVYPGLLILLAILAMVGLGVFQKLSQNVTVSIPAEKDESDKAAAKTTASARKKAS